LISLFNLLRNGKTVVVPCVSDVDCNGRRSAANNDSKDGCVCECLDGLSDNDCFVEPQQATTTIDAGKAIDDRTYSNLTCALRESTLSSLCLAMQLAVRASPT